MGMGYCFARDKRTRVEYHDVTDGVHEDHYKHEVNTNFLSVGLFSHFSLNFSSSVKRDHFSILLLENLVLHLIQNTQQKQQSQIYFIHER